MTEDNMKSSNSKKVQINMNFAGWLQLLFIGLKLTGHITWPWVWVLSPIWISLLIVILMLALFLILAAITNK